MGGTWLDGESGSDADPLLFDSYAVAARLARRAGRHDSSITEESLLDELGLTRADIEAIIAWSAQRAGLSAVPGDVGNPRTAGDLYQIHLALRLRGSDM